AQVIPSVTSAAPGSLGGPFEELPVAVQRRCVQAPLLALGVSPEYELIEHLRLKPEVPIGVPSSPDPQRPTGQGEVREVFRTMLGAVQWRPKRDLTFKAAIAELHLEELSGQATFGHLRISWSVKTGRNGRKPMPVQGSEVFDADRVGSPILLRFWRPGDRFQPIGTNCSVKLQDFLTNRRVPAERRRQLLLGVSAAGEVFWVEGQRISERFKLTPTTIRRLHWSWQQL
ncbi:MAG TPA: tRNA lysidine(34) synthetase TilS, partial [Verrucomicrobiae bacterium]|nr:tRNA lysidine(34) synthetase TilS [Verrucomicrobiae bacterium]